MTNASFIRLLIICILTITILAGCDNDSHGYKGECPKGQHWVERVVKSEDGSGLEYHYQACE